MEPWSPGATKDRDWSHSPCCGDSGWGSHLWLHLGGGPGRRQPVNNEQALPPFLVFYLSHIREVSISLPGLK